MLTPERQKEQSTKEVVAEESGHYTPLLDISLFLWSPCDISIIVPNCCLWLTVSCGCLWKVLQPVALRQWKQPVSVCCVRDSQLHVGLLQEDNEGRLIHLLSGWASPCHALTQGQDSGLGMQPYSPMQSDSSLTDRPSQKHCWRFLPFSYYHSKQVCTVVGQRVSCQFSSDIWIIPNGRYIYNANSHMLLTVPNMNQIGILSYFL